jgi:hypothetical protein
VFFTGKPLYVSLTYASKVRAYPEYSTFEALHYRALALPTNIRLGSKGREKRSSLFAHIMSDDEKGFHNIDTSVNFIKLYSFVTLALGK